MPEEYSLAQNDHVKQRQRETVKRLRSTQVRRKMNEGFLAALRNDSLGLRQKKRPERLRGVALQPKANVMPEDSSLRSE